MGFVGGERNGSVAVSGRRMRSSGWRVELGVTGRRVGTGTVAWVRVGYSGQLKVGVFRS